MSTNINISYDMLQSGSCLLYHAQEETGSYDGMDFRKDAEWKSYYRVENYSSIKIVTPTPPQQQGQLAPLNRKTAWNSFLEVIKSKNFYKYYKFTIFAMLSQVGHLMRT